MKTIEWNYKKWNYNLKKIQKMENMQWNLSLVLKLALKFEVRTCTWQGQGKYHTNQGKQSSNTRGATTTRKEQHKLG